MSLEATVVILDNSQYSINGDYAPTRFGAQVDAVHSVFNHKIRQNPESEVGLMVMAGKSPEVLVTPTQDEGKLVAALHGVIQGGQADLVTGISVAQLALKHRQNKNQRQRIIAFVGSPISTSTQALIKLGKKMKKNNVAIDIVAFGEDGSATTSSSAAGTSSTTPAANGSSTEETNDSKLNALVEAVNSSDNSHFLKVEPGPYLLSDKIVASPILRGEGAGGSGGADGGMQDDDGVDPNLDPELAMALRMSLEEERARQAAANASSGSAAPKLESVPEGTSAGSTTAAEDSKPSVPETAATSVQETTAAASDDVGMQNAGEDHDEDLARALAMSRGDGGDDVEMAADDEDAEIARAIAMSMHDQNDEHKEQK